MNDVLQKALSHHFHYTSFRPGQREIITKLLAGENVLGILSTGGGKSVTYQLPAMMLPGIALVISPLISLMIDQVQQLRKRGWRNVAYVNSALEMSEVKRLLQEIGQGAYKLLYISPEKVQQPAIQKLLARRGVSLVAVDEAHCISQWGHDFRTDYLRLGPVIEALGKPPVLAVTATATQLVQEEICRLLHIRQENVISLSVNRPNIALDIIHADSELDKQTAILEQIERLQPPGIVYCSTRQAAEQLAAACLARGMDRVHAYHGGLSAMERVLLQEQFTNGQLDCMIATNAFGMGIDKADIRYVLHYQFPASIEAYTQEIGRIGRDGADGYAALFYHPDDIALHWRMIDHEYPSEAQMQLFVKRLDVSRSEGLRKLSYQEVLQDLDIGETALRLLFFYAEQAGLVSEVYATKEGIQYHLHQQDLDQVVQKMSRQLEQAKLAKYEKLRSMHKWLVDDGCYRAVTGVLRRKSSRENDGELLQFLRSHAGEVRQEALRRAEAYTSHLGPSERIGQAAANKVLTYPIITSFSRRRERSVNMNIQSNDPRSEQSDLAIQEQPTLPPRREKHRTKPTIRTPHLLRWGIYVFVAFFLALMVYEITQAFFLKKDSYAASVTAGKNAEKVPSATTQQQGAGGAKPSTDVKAAAATTSAPQATPAVAKTQAASGTPAVAKPQAAPATPAVTKPQPAPTKPAVKKKPAAKPKTIRYVVKKGDTLYKLARSYYYSTSQGVSRIARYNGLSPQAELVEGTVLYIPLPSK